MYTEIYFEKITSDLNFVHYVSSYLWTVYLWLVIIDIQIIFQQEKYQAATPKEPKAPFHPQRYIYMSRFTKPKNAMDWGRPGILNSN